MQEELVCTGCCRNNTVQIIVELVFCFILVGHQRRIGSDDGCIFIARQRKSRCHKAFINAFLKSWELDVKIGFDGKFYSCFTPLLTLASTPKERVSSTNFFDLSYLCKASLTQLLSLSCICQVPYQQEMFNAVVYLIQHCPSACAHSRRP